MLAANTTDELVKEALSTRMKRLKARAAVLDAAMQQITGLCTWDAAAKKLVVHVERMASGPLAELVHQNNCPDKTNILVIADQIKVWIADNNQEINLTKDMIMETVLPTTA